MPGTLRAVARRNGRVIATSEQRTSGPAARVVLTPYRRAIRGDGKDLSFITVTAVDSAGLPVPTAGDLVRFRVDGAASIAGVDNGDEVSHLSLKGDTMRLFNGKALLIVQSKRGAGTSRVTATSDRLQGGSATLEIVPARKPGR